MTETPAEPVPEAGVAVTHQAGETVPAGAGSGLPEPAHAATNIKTSSPMKNTFRFFFMV